MLLHVFDDLFGHGQVFAAPRVPQVVVELLIHPLLGGAVKIGHAAPAKAAAAAAAAALAAA